MESKGILNVTEADKTRAAEVKKTGNDFFQKQNFESAIESYTKAISLNPYDGTLYCNRSACYKKLKK